MKPNLRGILERLYESGYGVTGKSEEGTKFRVEECLKDIHALMPSEEEINKLIIDNISSLMFSGSKGIINFDKSSKAIYERIKL